MNRRSWQAGVTAHWDEMRPKLKGGAQDLPPFAVCFSPCLTSHILCTETSYIMHTPSVDTSTLLLSHCHSALLLSGECERYLCVCEYMCVHIRWRQLKENAVKMRRETYLREWECDTEAVKWQLEHNNSRTCFTHNPTLLIWDFFGFKIVILINYF